MVWIRPGGRGSGDGATGSFSSEDLDTVARFYAETLPTPLHRLTGLARVLGLGDVLVKDESRRLGLPAFKILGVRYAMARLLDEHPSIGDVACATAGNHGRAVARVARERGLSAHVYVPFGTPPASIDALRSEGAHVAVTSVDYDETVQLMAADAAAAGWTIVSDTSWPGYDVVPRWIMAGYTRLMQEAADEWGAPPDVVVVQAGVGSLAGAVAGWLQATSGRQRPAFVVVEPDGSACVLASLKAGRRVTLTECAPTSMAGLRCGDVSPVAWPILESTADAAVTISDAAAAEAGRRLAHPTGDDPQIVAGPSGAAGIGAIIAMAEAPALAELRSALALSGASRVFAVVTEGATGV